MFNLKISKNLSSNETSSKFRVQKLHFRISVTEDPPAKPNRSFKQKFCKFLICKNFSLQMIFLKLK